MKVLDAHAESIEAQAAQRLEMFARSDAWVDLDADFCIWRKIKILARKTEQVGKLFRRQISWRATAPMKLHHWSFPRNAASHVLDFALQYLQIRRSHALIFLNNYVARAEQAQAFAEGKMHVERNRSSRNLRFLMHGFEIVGSKGVIPDRCGGITGVARARAIVPREKFFIHAQFLTHPFKGGSHSCHSHNLSAKKQQA